MINNVPRQIAVLLQNQYRALQPWRTNVPPIEENNESCLEEEGSEDDRTLFVGNLDEQVTEELLYELFLQAGPLEKVNIPKKRSFGFVTYQHLCSIPYALNLFDGVQLCRKALTIKPKSRGNNLGERQHLPDDTLNMNDMAALSNLFNVTHNMLPSNHSDNRMVERRRDRDREDRDTRRRQEENNDRFSRHQNRQRSHNRRRDQRNNYF